MSEASATDHEAVRDVSRRYLDETARILSRVRDSCLDDIVAASDALASCLRSGGKILICGNGGSAADAQHLATELVGTLTRDRIRPSIPAIALTTDTSLLTAMANDFGVDRMFSRQVEALGTRGDALIAISTSGRSANVIAAAEEARARGLVVVALTGDPGGELARDADVAIRVPGESTAHIQECHLAIEQLLALLLERDLHPTP